MKRYYYELLDADWTPVPGAFIPDGRIKSRAIAQAKRQMKELGIEQAQLSINSLRTSNILEIVDIDLTE